MLYQDGITFADEVEAYQQFYPFGTQEDLMAVHSMSAQGKHSQYEVFDMNQFDHNSGAQYLPQSYDSPLTDQNDLAALPSGYGAEYNDGLYLHNQTDQYSSSTVVPSTSGPYVAGPMTASAPIQSQPVTYNVQPSKKRKASVDSFDGEAPRPKRIAVALQDPNGELYDLKSESSPYSSLVPTPTTISNFHHIPQQHTVSPRLVGHQHSTSNVSQMSVPATAPYTPTVSPSFTTANTEHSPRAPATPGPRSASAASNPRLVRTSTMPQHSPRLPSSMTMVGHTQNFNPYHLYSPDSKARLHLEGSLDDVAKDWSEEELEARRKIVVFERDQKGNDIYTSFKVVSQDDWKNHSRSVSCIWWAEKKEAYVTSVDTISLLEGIVAARFTVEEKNRIRRNLEGFKPDTVSKAKPETEEFFKVIMGFPNPKPRNIEKDVKVFPWKVLSVALQKIISKYSASYASTAASIPNHPKFRSMDHPAEFRYSNSPGPEYHVSTPQLANFPTYEPHGRVSMPMNAVTNLQIPPQVGYSHEAHPGYGYGHLQMLPQQPQHQPQQQHHHHQQQVQYHQAPMTAPPVAQQQYWHYPAYAVEGQMPMAPASAPPTAYPREMLEANDFRHVVQYGVHATHH